MSDTENTHVTDPIEPTEEIDAGTVLGAPAETETQATIVEDHVETAKETVKSSPAPVAVSENKKSVVSILKANPLYPKISHILHWRDPVRSGLVFGIISCCYILLGWFDYSVLTLVSYLLFALLAVCFGYAQFVHFRATWVLGRVAENPFIQNFKSVNFHVSKEEAQRHLNTVLDMVNLTIDKFTSVFFITNTFLALKFLAYFYILASVGEWFSGLTLAYLAALIAFVWPRTYEEKKTDIDRGLALAQSEYKKYSAVAVSKLPPAVRKYVEVPDKKRD